MKKVSVIIPNYNHEKFLRKRLETVYNQTYNNFEVILLDDASTDNSVEILKEYEDNNKTSCFVINEKNSGSSYKQWLKGIEFATGHYIWIAESDDYSDLNFLTEMMNFISKDDEINLVYCRSVMVNEKEEFITVFQDSIKQVDVTKWKKNYINDGLKELEETYWATNHIANASSVLFSKKQFYKEVFPNKEDFINRKLAGDKIFWTYMMKTGKVAFLAKEYNFFRSHPNNVRKTANEYYNLIDNFYWIHIMLKIVPLSKDKKKTLDIWLYGWWQSMNKNRFLPNKNKEKELIETAKIKERFFIFTYLYWWLRFNQFYLRRKMIKR